MLATCELDRILSNTKMAAMQQNLTKMVSAQLRIKANEFLNSRKHANNLADILQMFEVSTAIRPWPFLIYKNCAFRLGTSSIAYLTQIAFVFQAETDNYTPLLLTIEVIFTELLKRGDLIQEIVPLKPIGKSCVVFSPRFDDYIPMLTILIIDVSCIFIYVSLSNISCSDINSIV